MQEIFHFDETIYNLRSQYDSSLLFPILLIRSPTILLIHLHLKKRQLDILDVFELLLFSIYVQVKCIFQAVSANHLPPPLQ